MMILKLTSAHGPTWVNMANFAKMTTLGDWTVIHFANGSSDTVSVEETPEQIVEMLQGGRTAYNAAQQAGRFLTALVSRKEGP